MFNIIFQLKLCKMILKTLQIYISMCMHHLRICIPKGFQIITLINLLAFLQTSTIIQVNSQTTKKFNKICQEPEYVILVFLFLFYFEWLTTYHCHCFILSLHCTNAYERQVSCFLDNRRGVANKNTLEYTIEILISKVRRFYYKA